MTAADGFGAAALREQVLAAWTASPDRFREDANAEDDLVRGGYRDRLVVELAQNAADAAARAGIPGRLRLELTDTELLAANTGAPLDAAGVRALSTLRASAKREHAAVGRFGVGFAAVLAVTDAPAVVSTTGGVQWEAAETRALVQTRPTLRDELERRGGQVPVLRLPFPVAGEVPDGFDTVVRLPLRDRAAHDLAARLLDELDLSLLLALPALAAVDVVVGGRTRSLGQQRDGDRVVVDDAGHVSTWRLHERQGQVDAGLLADRPVEERERRSWSVLWAVPVDADGAPQPLPADVPAVVHAPTPTDEPLSVGALLVASFPVDASRRHVAPGALTDFLVAAAAGAYADLVVDLAPAPSVLGLVPTAFPAGAIDAALADAVRDELRTRALLPSAADPARRLAPPVAVALDAPGDVTVAVADAFADLLDADWAAPRWTAALGALGVERLPLAALVERLAGLDRPPAWWHALYAALAGAADLDALGALPVPLVGGRRSIGARGLLVPEAELPGAETLPVRLVDPAAAHPLLLRLGAVPATARSLLADADVHLAVAESVDLADEGEDVAPLADAVLGLAAAAGLRPGDEPALAALALPVEDGEVYPAGELLLPTSPLPDLLVADAPLRTVAREVVDRFGAAALTAVGVLDTFAVLTAADVPADADAAEHDLDDEEGYLDAVGPGVLARLVAVRDLELVRDDAWPAALDLLARPPLRSALLERASVRDTESRSVPSYTAWWLARHARLPAAAGRSAAPAGLAAPDATAAVRALFDPLDGSLTLEPAVLRAIGCLGSLDDIADDDGVGRLLARLADPARSPSWAAVLAAYDRIGVLGVVPAESPERLRALTTTGVAVVDAADVLVVAAPDLLPLLGTSAAVPARVEVADALADVLDVPLADSVVPTEVRSVGRAMPWAEVPGVERVCRRLGVDLPTGVVGLHDGLTAVDLDGQPVAVPWRALPDTDFVDTGAGSEALAAALAWRLGRWDAREAVGAALRATDDEWDAAERDLGFG